jgi:hypothetical protein
MNARRIHVRIVAALAVALVAVTVAAPLSAQSAPPQVPAALSQLDKRLQREPCQVKVPNMLPAEVVLDGSGRFADLIATAARPAYWDSSVKSVTFRNQPASHEGDLPDDLVLEAEGNGQKLAKDLKANGSVTISREDVTAVANGGLALLTVKRHRALVSTLTLIMRSGNVILLNADGPVDPIFRSTTAPAFMNCDFQLEYVRGKDDAGPPVVVAPQLKTIQTPKPGETPKEPLKPIQVPASGPVDVTWADLERHDVKRGDEVQLVALKDGRAVSVLWLTQKASGTFTPIAMTEEKPKAASQPGGAQAATGGAQAAPPASKKRIEVILDRLGIASPDFLNRRRPAYIPDSDADIEMMFTSEVSDRAYVVTFSGIPESERAELVRSGAQIGACRDGKCQAAIRVPPSASAVISLTALRRAYARSTTGSTVTFGVAFFDDDTTPANSRGYLTFFDKPFFSEPGNSTSWTGALSVSLQNDPDLSAAVPPGGTVVEITPANPIERPNRSHVNGSATAGLKQSMGSRADFEVELTAKNGDFGADSSFKASKYLANIYTSYGATITGGRLDIAAPTEAIAFAESGDAINAGGRIGPGYGSIGFVFRRELTAEGFSVGKVEEAIKKGANSLDRNNQDVVLQWRDLKAGRFRAGVYGVYGLADRGRVRTTSVIENGETKEQKELVSFDARAWSAGGETAVTLGHSSVSLGIYRSERSNDADADLARDGDKASGYVGLASLRYTNIDHDKVEGNQLATDFSMTAQVGRGGRYVGENQGFAPDALFLNKFAGVLSGADGAIGPGLTNKWYFGFLATTPKILKNKGATTLELHHYRLGAERAGSRNLGTEASIEFRLEEPKGVRYQITGAFFVPGGALNPADASLKLISKVQWAIKVGVTVRME